MIANVVAFLAVAASAVLAAPCGVLTTGCTTGIVGGCGTGFYGAGYGYGAGCGLGCARPAVGAVFTAPTLRSTLAPACGAVAVPTCGGIVAGSTCGGIVSGTTCGGVVAGPVCGTGSVVANPRCASTGFVKARLFPTCGLGCNTGCVSASLC